MPPEGTLFALALPEQEGTFDVAVPDEPRSEKEIIEAIGLAKCLRDIPNVEDVFPASERPRKNRAEKIAKDVRCNSNQKEPTNAFTRWVRVNIEMKII